MLKYNRISLIKLLITSIMFICIVCILELNASASQNDNAFDIAVSGFKIRTILPKEIKTQETVNAAPKMQKDVPKAKYIVVQQKKEVKSNSANKSIISSKHLKTTTHNNNWYYDYRPSRNISRKHSSYVKKKPYENKKIPLNVSSVDRLDNNYDQTHSTASKYSSKASVDNQKLDDINKLNDNSNKLKTSEPVRKSTEPSFLKLLTSLFFVIVLIVVVGWFTMKLKNVDPASILSGKLSEKGINKFRILYTATIGQGKNIHIVDINGKQLVIGSTSNNINLLTELQPAELQKEKETVIAEKAKSNDFDCSDPDIYANTYSELYKEYISDKKD